VFLSEDQNVKNVKHMASYTNIASRMLLVITCNCSCYSTEQSTNGCRYTYCMALIMPRDLVNGGIWDVHCQPLQVLLYSLVVNNG
jgi:hypothetical protein